MSTKIYNGWLVQGTDMTALRKKCQKLSKEIKQIATAQAAKIAAWKAVRLLDQYAMSGKKVVVDTDEITLPLSASITFFMMMQVHDKAVEASRSPLRSSFDLGCSLVAFPMKWKGKEITPITFYDHSMGSAYTPAFERIIKPEPLPYWNNTDQPEDMTRGQWTERERLWDRAMGDGIPSENGFTFELITSTSYPFRFSDEMKDQLREIKWSRRVARTAEEYRLLRATKVIARRAKKEGREIGTGDISDIWGWERSAAGRKALAKGKELARACLKRRITPTDISVEVSSVAKEAKPKVESAP